MTPKKHPEIAGHGVEYGWGKAKYEFRHSNDYSPNSEAFEKFVRFSLLPVTLARARKYLRRVNDYKRAYRELEVGGSVEAAAVYADIQKIKRKCKTHRCTFDQDYAFIVKS